MHILKGKSKKFQRFIVIKVALSHLVEAVQPQTTTQTYDQYKKLLLLTFS